MRKLLLLSALTLLTCVLKAQDFTFGTFTEDEMHMKQYAKDTSAHAVVLGEFGRAEINNTNDDKIKIIFRYHVRIKIFDSQGFDQATAAIHAYGDGTGEDDETVENIKGITTYMDDNGGIKQAELEDDKIFKIKDNKYWATTKFTMPDIRNGCIIEYTYTKYSVYWNNFPVWNFQSDIPKIYSEFDVHIPAYWTYNASLRGNLKLSKNISVAEDGCFTVAGNTVNCSHIDLEMNNIPAFTEEADMTSYKNFISAAYFELAEYIWPYDGTKHKISKEWADVDYDLKHNEEFGSQLRRKELMKERIAPVIAGISDSLQKAIAIYNYIKKNIKWNEFYATGSDIGIRKALDGHSGSVADINLALTTSLEAAGFNAEAVLSSTRENGFVNKLYPTTSEFNYVITKVDIGGKTYLLDATDPLLPFGMLPLRCLNDQGRVMSLDKPSYWIDLTTTGQRGADTYNYDLTLQPDGKLRGTMTHYSSGYEGYEHRQAIKKYNSVDEYVESLDERWPKFKILKSNISNLDSLDMPLGETYEIEIKEFNGLDKAKLSFSPFIMDYKSVNPYKLTERNYPVDMGIPVSERRTLTLHLPDNYVVDTPPQAMAIGLPNNGGKFETFYQLDDNTITFSYIIQLNKSIYSSQEYPYLKELYNKIILAQKARVILKQKI